MKVQGLVGPQINADGVDTEPRLLRDGSQAVSDVHGKYHEAAVRGKLFVLDSDAVTLAAANTTKGAAGTIKFVSGFYNPATSGVNISILKAILATVSGTPAGGFFYNFLQPGVGTTSAATGTIRNLLLGGPGSVATPLANVIVGLSGAATTAFSQLATIGGPTAVAATGAVETIVDEPAGAIIVPPGTFFGIAGSGAGTTHIVQSSLIWEELPV